MKRDLSQTNGKTNVRRGAIRWLIRETLGNLFLIAILFGVVGRWDWWMGWALVLEDKTLHDELLGYKEYAARVRYRLLPGVW